MSIFNLTYYGPFTEPFLIKIYYNLVLRNYLAEAEAEQNRNVQVQGSNRQHMNYRYLMKDDKLMIHVILNIKTVSAKMNLTKHIILIYF
jgi:hypothetical protein